MEPPVLDTPPIDELPAAVPVPPTEELVPPVLLPLEVPPTELTPPVEVVPPTVLCPPEAEPMFALEPPVARVPPVLETLLEVPPVLFPLAPPVTDDVLVLELPPVPVLSRALEPPLFFVEPPVASDESVLLFPPTLAPPLFDELSHPVPNSTRAIEPAKERVLKLYRRIISLNLSYGGAPGVESLKRIESDHKAFDCITNLQPSPKLPAIWAVSERRNFSWNAHSRVLAS